MYTRVSTEDQAREGFSLRAQEARLRAYAGARGWQVAGEYRDDGFTGTDVRRPAYRRMMDEAERWDAILVLKMDRIHRNARNFMAMMDDLRRWGKDFVSATESLDTSTATGRFVADMLQRIAQLESEQTGERVHLGMHQAALEGRFLGMSDPYGFRYDPATRNLVVVPREAAVVREIFRLRRGGRRSATGRCPLRASGGAGGRRGELDARTFKAEQQGPALCPYRQGRLFGGFAGSDGWTASRARDMALFRAAGIGPP